MAELIKFCTTHQDGRFEWIKDRNDIIMDHCDRWFIEDDKCAIVEVVEKSEYDRVFALLNNVVEDFVYDRGEGSTESWIRDKK